MKTYLLIILIFLAGCKNLHINAINFSELDSTYATKTGLLLSENFGGEFSEIIYSTKDSLPLVVIEDFAQSCDKTLLKNYKYTAVVYTNYDSLPSPIKYKYIGISINYFKDKKSAKTIYDYYQNVRKDSLIRDKNFECFAFLQANYFDFVMVDEEHLILVNNYNYDRLIFNKITAFLKDSVPLAIRSIPAVK
jgi:hypothetical protein